MKGGLALTLMLVVTLSTSAALAEGRRSGTILAIAPGAGVVTFEEISEGIAPGRNRILTQPISLTPETVITLVSRVEEADSTEWPGGFRETPLAPGDLRTGDYATIDTVLRDGKRVALSVRVVRPVTPER
jgi:hypothetical protein